MSDVLLAQKWSDEDPTGWWVSEKLDGVRALWKNGEFVSRGDNSFVCPDWFRRKMPMGCTLDGELWGGRRQFQKTVGIVKSATRSAEWEFLTYMVFDVLQEGSTSLERLPFEERLSALERICSSGDGIKAVPMQKCKGKDHLFELLGEVERRGGEGLMLRAPGSTYEHRRSKSLLKVKTFHDEEAVVVSHETGKGRNSGVCGALVCKTPDGRQFKVGSGLSDEQRSDPPKVGDVITYRYQELTAANIPRFPTLVGLRIDLDWRQVCATYVAPGPRAALAMKKKHSVLFGDSSLMPAPATVAAATAASGLTATGVPQPAAVVPSEARRQLKRTLSPVDAMQLGVAEEDLVDLRGEESPDPPAKKARTSAAADTRPICVYGTKCYRKNPLHFEEFAHPWLDAENLDVEGRRNGAASVGESRGTSSTAAPHTRISAVDAIAGIAASTADLGAVAAPAAQVASAKASSDAAAASARAPECVDIASATAATPMSRWGRAAAERPDVMSMLLASSTSLFSEGRANPAQAAAAAKQSDAAAVVAAAEPSVEAQALGQPTSALQTGAARRPEADAHATQAGDPAMLNLPGVGRAFCESTSDQAPTSTKPLRPSGTASPAVTSPDQRIFALRSLLAGLSHDAPSNAERAHYTYLLDLLDAGPSGTSDERSEPKSAALKPPTGPRSSISPIPPPLHEVGEASVFALDAEGDAARVTVSGLPPVLPPATLSSRSTTVGTTMAPVGVIGGPAMAEPPAPADVPASVHQEPPEDLGIDTPAKREASMTLQNMGFTADDVVAALRHADALEPALDWLLARAG